MDQQQKDRIRGYELQVTVSLEKDGRYRGMILISKRGDTQQVYAKPVLIETPSSFKSAHAALIEASAYAQELIYNGAIKALLPADAPAQNRQAPKPPDFVGN